MKTFMKWTGIVTGGLIVLAVLAGLVLYPVGMKKLTRSYAGIAVEAVNIPADPDSVANGRHIAIIWGCTKCHGEDLSGKLLANDPFLGAIPASNLTSGNGGIAKSYGDVDWIRAIRHGVKPEGKGEILMYDYYSSMSDRDLGALVAYLKQIQPVDADYPALRYGSILPVAPVVGLYLPAAELIDHSAPRPPDPAPGVTREYGKYLSAICVECHGNYVAGKLEKWNREDFIRTIHTGVKPDGKQLGPTMSSKTFSEMSDIELSALWLYFTDSKP